MRADRCPRCTAPPSVVLRSCRRTPRQRRHRTRDCLTQPPGSGPSWSDWIGKRDPTPGARTGCARKSPWTSAVGEYGMVTQLAESYRRAVDEHLLHLGPDRYASLVDLLVQLRQPQLSRRPDEGKLSRALSEALAPVDQSVIADIATAFHDLEQQRDELSALKETRGHVARFSQRYQHYARVASRRQSRDLRAAQSAYEQVGRDLGGIRDEIAAARMAETEAPGDP